MTRGFDPVESQTQLNGGATTVDELVEDRLAAYDFKANNAADFQTVDVVIPASGSIDISHMFKYNTAPNGYTGIPDFNKLPVGFVAAVVDPGNGSLPVGAVTQPIYLQNNGTPVQVDGTGPVPSTYYQMVGNRLKVQVEDAAGGANPPAGWVFQNDDDGGKQAGFQGSGYYYWKSELGTTVNAPQGGFTVSFYVESAGTYTLRARSSRDCNSPVGDRNDVWVKIDDNAEALLPAGTADIVSNSGFVKLFGASTGWGFSSNLDTVSDATPNVAAKFSLSAGYHTITFAGRAEGYHLDFFELYKGTAPAIGASNTPLITSDQGPSGSTSASVAAGNGDIEISTLPTGVLAANLTSANLEFGSDNYGSNDPAEPQKVNVVGMRFNGLDLPAGTEITDAYLEFQAYATNSVASDFEISIQNSLTGGVFTTTVSNFTGRSFVGGVDWVPEAWVAGQTYRTPDISGLIEQVIGSGGLDAADVLVFRVTGTGVREAHSFEASGAQPVLRINYGGSANVAPTDISLSNQSVTEEQAGAVIGNVSVVDPNVGDTHTFTVNDNRFEVVGGQLKLKSGISLDFETQPSVSVIVTATDNGGLSLSETFVIGVVDDPNDNGPTGTTFTATVVNANGDIEQGVVDHKRRPGDQQGHRYPVHRSGRDRSGYGRRHRKCGDLLGVRPHPHRQLDADLRRAEPAQRGGALDRRHEPNLSSGDGGLERFGDLDRRTEDHCRHRSRQSAECADPERRLASRRRDHRQGDWDRRRPLYRGRRWRAHAGRAHDQGGRGPSYRARGQQPKARLCR